MKIVKNIPRPELRGVKSQKVEGYLKQLTKDDCLLCHKSEAGLVRSIATKVGLRVSIVWIENQQCYGVWIVGKKK